MRTHKFLLFWFAAAMLHAPVVRSQIATYSFENTIDDNNGTYTSAYQLLGIDPAMAFDLFVNGTSGKAIQLDPSESIKLPLTLSQALVSNESFEMVVNVKYIDDGIQDNDGVKPIFTLKGNDGWGSPGFTLFTQKDFGNPGRFSLILLYADGWGEANGSEPSFYNLIGSFTAGEWLEVTVIFDFANNAVIASAGNAYSQQPFDPNFDINQFKSDMAGMNANLGWINGMAESIEFNPNVYTGMVHIDELTIYSPRKPASTSDLKAALSKMTRHVNGLARLGNTELQAAALTVNKNYLGKYFEAKDAFDQYIQAYESASFPMFSSEVLVNVPVQSPEFFIAFQLQQEVFDKGFVAGKMETMAGMSFEAHENWPGRVSSAAPRLSNQEVEINGTYLLDPGYVLLGEDGGARRPTGYYAAPGELITITVDPSWVGQGIKAYIGGHVNDIGNKLDKTNRFVRISKELTISGTTTKIANPFGGGIYFVIPPGLNLGWAKVKIDGAVKAPYFRWIPGRESSVSEFTNEVKKGHVQWMDLESEYWMVTLPINMLVEKDISQVMTAWDNMWKAVLVASGRPLAKNRTEYFMFDRRMATESIGAGYPMALGLHVTPYQASSNNQDNPLRVLDADWLRNSSNGTIVHEMGHNMGFPTLGKEVETIVQLVGVPAYQVGLGHPLDSAWKYVENENHTSDLAAINWMIAQNFRNNQPMGCDPTIGSDPGGPCNELRYQMRGFAKYVDVARLFGWEGLGKVFKSYYDYWAAGGERMDREFVTDSSMIYAMNTRIEKNVNPLLHFWGLIPTEAQVQEFSNLAMSHEVYQRLVYYRGLVPTSRVAFKPWYDRLYATLDPIHRERIRYTLNNYDSENLGQKIVDQINFIITTYYGSGDHDNDGFSITEECDDFNASVNPNQTEILGNGLDDDCNPATPDVILSVDDPVENVINIFPNPVRDQVHIALDGIPVESLMIVDVTGKTVQAVRGLKKETITMDLSDLKTGIYSVKLVMEDQLIVKKIIVSH